MPTPTRLTPLRGTPAIAKFLGISHGEVLELVRQGLPVYAAGREVHAKPAAVQRWFDARVRGSERAEIAASRQGGVARLVRK